MEGKKWVATFLAFAVTFAIAFFAARMIFSSNDYSSQLLKLSEKMNAKMPVMIDSETRLDSASASGDTLQYHYTLVNIAKEDGPDIAGAKTFLMNQSQNNLDNGVEMKEYRENNISLKYHYSDKNAKGLLEFKISPTQK